MNDATPPPLPILHHSVLHVDCVHCQHAPQDTLFPEATMDVCALAMTTLAGPERHACLEAAAAPWANEAELRGWMAMVDWVLMTLRNTHSWMAAGGSGRSAWQWMAS